MFLDQINLNYLRIFEAVYRTRSMTMAATELHLTQSGISQHIKSLEETLQLALFDRIKQKLVPTEAGEDLYKQLTPHLAALEKILLNVTRQDDSLRGEVCIGLPVVFGLNLVIPLLTKLSHEHPHIKFALRFDLAPKFNQLLLSGDVDFAFVDEFQMDSMIATKNVYNEVLKLCCSQEYLKKVGPPEGKKKYFQSLDYICYDPQALIARKWFAFHFKYHSMELKLKAEVADALGVGKLITSHLGVGVLPQHQVEKLKKDGHKLYTFSGKEISRDLKNKISLAYVKGRSWSKTIQSTYEHITEELEKRARV